MDEFVGPGSPLSSEGFDAALATLGAEPAALWAVLATETSGCGYLPDRRPKILFERHYFHRLTNGAFDATDPDISAPSAGGYGAGGAHQYLRLAAALQLDREAALRSASWGLGQIMGDNFKAAGFADVESMVSAFVNGEDAQLAGMAAFVAASPMKAALHQQDWTTFARLYNGPNYAASNYDGHLQSAFDRFTSHGLPDLQVRQAQVWLTYRGYDTGGIDGVIGPSTIRSLRSFQQSAGLATTDGTLTAETLEALAKPPA